MIKELHLKESTINDDSDSVQRAKKLESKYFTFVNFDERKLLNALRLGMYFRQSLVGMVAYQQHGNVLANDFEESEHYDEDQD